MSRVFPVQGYTGDVPLHWNEVPGGSDLFAPAGTPVLAMTSGVILSAGWNDVGGWNVTQQGDDGLLYYYAHLDRQPAVWEGERVSAGTYLGGVGNTGNATQTAPHLHIGIGPEIVRGMGPSGGTGGDFDAVGLLREALTAAAAVVAIPGFDYDVVEIVARENETIRLPFLLLLALAHGRGGLKRPFAVGDHGQSFGPYQVNVAQHGGDQAYWEVVEHGMRRMAERWQQAFTQHGGWPAWWYDHYTFIREWAPAAQGSGPWNDDKAHQCIGHALDTLMLFHREQLRRASSDGVPTARVRELEAAIVDGAAAIVAETEKLRALAQGG